MTGETDIVLENSTTSRTRSLPVPLPLLGGQGGLGLAEKVTRHRLQKVDTPVGLVLAVGEDVSSDGLHILVDDRLVPLEEGEV